MRDKERDELWIREKVRGKADETVYITPNHYDGGYEVRVGTVDFFVDYESIDRDDSGIFNKYL